jgi:hypothetical protein
MSSEPESFSINFSSMFSLIIKLGYEGLAIINNKHRIESTSLVQKIKNNLFLSHIQIEFFFLMFHAVSFK